MSANNKSNKRSGKKNKRGAKVQDTRIVSQRALAGDGGTRAVLFRDVMPSTIITKLTYNLARSVANNGFNTASIQLTANGVYDVDPTLGSTSVPGFTEWMALYGRYRVLKNKATVDFVNREAFPVLVCLALERTAFAANAKTLAYFNNRDSKKKILPPLGQGHPVRLSISASATEIMGSQEVVNEDSFLGTSGANPGINWFNSVAVDCSYLGATLAVGVAVMWQLEFWVQFEQPRALSS